MKEKVTDYEIMNEYFEKSKLFDNGSLPKNCKMAGNIFAVIIRNNIEKILEGTSYKVSLNNSFIEGIRNEWDLIIVKRDSTDNDVNIYNQKDVKCVIELKTATFIKSGDWKVVPGNEEYNEEHYKNDIIERFKVFETALEPVSNHCRYLYVSLFQNPNHKAAECLTNVINNMKLNKDKEGYSTFFFRVDTRYSSPCTNVATAEEEIKKFMKEKDDEAFKHFILNALK